MICLSNYQLYQKVYCLTETVHIGGPVEHGRGFILHSCDYVAKDSSINVTDKISMTASLEILEDISKGKGPNDYLLSLGIFWLGSWAIRS